MDSSIPIELKFTYPSSFFGLSLEFGALLSQNNSWFHFLIGPTFFVINNPQMRLPITLGLDVTSQGTLYIGLGGIISFNYRLTKNIYLGISMELNYYINNPYEEIVRYVTRDPVIGVDGNGNPIYNKDENGDPIMSLPPTPIRENKDHFGSYIQIKPMIGIGFQF